MLYKDPEKQKNIEKCGLVKIKYSKKTGEIMTWDNYGQGDDKWNIDHVIPCAKFDLVREEEQRKCFYWTNLQSLWQPENFEKGTKVC